MSGANNVSSADLDDKTQEIDLEAMDSSDGFWVSLDDIGDWQAGLDNFFLPEGSAPIISQDFNSCQHEWAEIALLHKVVYDCKKCGIKKEDVES